MKRGVCIALVICAVVYAGYLLTRSFTPLHPGVGAAISGAFSRDGQYGKTLAYVRGARVWGSWAGDDRNTGTIAVGSFDAPARLRFAANGSPSRSGNEVFIELASTGERRAIPLTDLGTHWMIVDVNVPPAWIGQKISLGAIDASSGPGGWLAISEPLGGGRGTGNAAFFATLAAWLVNGLLLALLFTAAWRWWAGRAWLPSHWEPLAAAGTIALGGYLAFWAYFADATLGKCFSLGLLGFASWRVFSTRANAARSIRDLVNVAALVTGIGLFYLSLLHLFPSSLDFHGLAANRFRAGLPGDNTLPHNLASALFQGQPLRSPTADWLSSDRPPLQSGWQLLTWPLCHGLDLEDTAASGTAAVWFQLLWVPAIYALLRSFGLARSRASAWTVVLSFTGFFALNTVFTWPKLAAGAFMSGAFALWVLEKNRCSWRTRFGVGGTFAGLAWLAHGGAAFSLLAVAPWALRRSGRAEWRGWALAAAAFLILALPWAAYQKFYDPPGNRLFKWHFAGQIAKDSRGPWAALRDNYGALSVEQIAEEKLLNFKTLTGGDWKLFGNFSAENAGARRDDEFFLLGHTLTWWVLGAVALAFAFERRQAHTRLAVTRETHLALGRWVLGTLVIWCLLMFQGTSTTVHQGSYAAVFALFVLFSVWFELAGKGVIVAVGLLQAASFATTWAVANPTINGPVNPLAAASMATALVGLGWFLFRRQGHRRTRPAGAEAFPRRAGAPS